MIIRAIDAVNETVGRVVSIIAVVFAAIIIYDAFDVTKQLFGFYFVMLGGYALRHRAHVQVDILTERLGPNALRVVEVLGYIIFFFPFTWVFVTRSWEFALRSWNQGETTYGAIQMPVYPLKMAMCVAAGLLLIQGVSEVLKILLGQRPEQE